MAETRSDFLDISHTTTMTTLSESNLKRRHPSDPSSSVKDLRLKRVCIDLHANVESDVQGDAKNNRYDDVNGIEFDSKQSNNPPQEMKSDDMPNGNSVDVNAEQNALISDEPKFENPDKNKLVTPLCPRSKLVENSSSVSFKRLLPYLKNLTEDESSGIKICHSNIRSSNSEKNVLRDVNTMGGLNGIRPAVALAGMNGPSSLVNKTGISSRFQSRLIGNLSSPSYKRMLPYLNDLAKDNLSNISAANTHCNMGKVESANEIHFQSSDSPVTTVNSPAINIKDPILEGDDSFSLEVPCTSLNKELNDDQPDEILEDPVNVNTDIFQSTSLDADMLKNNDSFQSTPENKAEEKSAPFDNIPLAAGPNHNSEDHVYTCEGNSHLYNNILVENHTTGVILTDSPDFEFETLNKSLSLTPATFNNLSLDELSGGGNKEHFEEASRVKIDGNQALTPKKGILKKNTTECQGMCMCLDCHLHSINAEKAFEFSRKQLSCANEVVEGLVKELSCLRKTMEKSAGAMVNGAERYSVLQLDQKQVRCVCQRAHKVEEHAKIYMKQMFSDLNNHCRPPGPRVTFSDTLEDKVHL